MADQAGVPQITNTGQAPPGYTFVHQGDPGAIPSDLGGHTFYIAPIDASKTGGTQGSGSGDMGGGGLRNYPVVGVDPNQPLTNLGAAALGQSAYYPPQPGAGTGGDTGVTGSGGSGFAGGGGLTIGGVSTQRPMTTTSGVVPKAPKGPWNDVPSLFNKATAMQPTAPLAVTPTPQATGMAYRPGQSWATPPPAPITTIQSATGMQYAPGRNWPQAQQDSTTPPPAPGGAAPMPMGQMRGGQGVPQNWQGAGQAGGIPSGGNQVAGSAIALGTSPGARGGGGAAPNQPPVKQFAAGGIVTQPTMGLVGENGPEAILPLSDQDWTPQQRAMLNQLIRAVTQSGDVNANLTASLGRPSPLRPAAGPNSQLRTPTPTPESNVVAGQQYPPPQQPPQQQRPPQQRPQQMPSTQRSSAQDYADWANQGGSMGGKAGAVYDAQGNLVTSSGNLTAQAAAGSGATMMPGGGVRDASGLVYDSSANLAAQDVGGAGATMPAGGAASGGGGSQMGSAISGGIGAIGGALQKMFDPSNIPSWKMQPSAIPAAPSSNRYAPNYKFATQDITNWNQLPEHLRPSDIYA